MATFSYRRANILVLLLACVLVIVCIGALYFAGNLARFQEAISVKEGQTALRGVDDPEQLEHVLKQYPSNRVLKMVALANGDSIEIDTAMRRLLSEAEPRDLLKPAALTESSRADLEALGRELKTAKGSAATVMPRFTALLKTARDKLNHEARPLEVGNYTLAKFMDMIDEQHKDMSAIMPEALAARVEYDSAYEQCVSLLIEHFGDYRVLNGQLVFPSQSMADRYNVAATAMTAVAKRMARLESERTALRQSQLTRWKSFVEAP